MTSFAACNLTADVCTAPGAAEPKCDYPNGADSRVSLSEVVSALSYGLDLTEGQPPGHSVRSCLIGMRIAAALSLDAETRSALYYALLLKDAGCSSNAAQTADRFGADDRQVKRRHKLTNWSRPAEAAKFVAGSVGPGRSVLHRARHFVKVATAAGGAAALFRVRCERGAAIASSIGFPDATAAAIRCLDEHWDGQGQPSQLAGKEIPLLARIACLAQTLEVFVHEYGPDRALAVMERRSGAWFDPALIAIVRSWKNDVEWWRLLQSEIAIGRITEAEPADCVLPVDDEGLDTVARAFAGVIDAKSPFTFQHSSNVAQYAVSIGRCLCLPAQDERTLFRAGLLHDIGKLGVSNQILDKPSALTPEERLEIQKHPVFTWEILSRVGPFRYFARMAALHHERLDGKGYPWKLDASGLSLHARILAVADIYEALTADRPYRNGMPVDKAMEILRKESGTGVDPEVVETLRRCLE